MKLSIENIGKIRKAEIDLEGITVIAGENDTGKSTAGKSLWALLAGRFELPKRAEDARRHAVENELTSRLSADGAAKLWSGFRQARELAREIMERFDQNTPLEELEEYLSDKEFRSGNSESASAVAKRVIKALSQNDNDYRISFTHDAFRDLFHGQPVSLRKNVKTGAVTLREGRTVASAKFTGQQCTYAGGALSQDYIPILIESPNDLFRVFRLQNHAWHDDSLQADLVDQKRRNVEQFSFDQENYALIEELRERVNHLRPVRTTRGEGRSIVLVDSDGIDSEVLAENASLGTKSLMWLDKLLEFGILDSSTVLILDEPEIHLHPQWQLPYAHLLVQIRKELQCQILVTTHSPYFVEALELYAQREQIADCCNWYLTSSSKGNAEIERVTNRVDKIYRQMAGPTYKLEELAGEL